MEIKKCKYRIRCEMGACGNRADWTLQPARVGIRSSVHICSDCLKSIVTEGKKLITKKREKKEQAGVCEGQMMIDDYLGEEYAEG